MSAENLLENLLLNASAVWGLQGSRYLRYLAEILVVASSLDYR